MNAEKLLVEVRENLARLDGCPAHRFDTSAYLPGKFGQKLTCIYCGGKTNARDALTYARGYAAAGGNPDDVWPGFSQRRKNDER